LKSEVGGWKSEVRTQKLEVGTQKSEVVVGSRKSEVRSKKTETEVGSPSSAFVIIRHTFCFFGLSGESKSFFSQLLIFGAGMFHIIPMTWVVKKNFEEFNSGKKGMLSCCKLPF